MSLPYVTIDPVAESLGVEENSNATEFGPVARQPYDAAYQEFATLEEHIPHKLWEQDEFKML